MDCCDGICSVRMFFSNLVDLFVLKMHILLDSNIILTQPLIQLNNMINNYDILK